MTSATAAPGATHRARLYIEAAPRVVRAVLLEPLRLHHWNPAFASITGPATAAIGKQYRITVRPGLSGELAYTGISESRIDMAWSVAGFHEAGTWTLRSRDRGTEVSHHFQHAGPLAALLRPAFRDVAALRLTRLAEVALRRRARSAVTRSFPS